MGGNRKNSSLLAKYSLMYEKKPRSRVFAPLAETYRKLGMLDEAISILQKGIKHHPSYTLGYIVLASCYFDLQNYEMSYNSIRSFVPNNLENLSMQKLFAKVCMKLGYLDEALATYKNLLLLNPRDPLVAEQVKLLEDDLLLPEANEFQPQAENNSTSFDEDNWVQVNFGSNKQPVSIEEDLGWEVEKSSEPKQSSSLIDKFKEDINSERLEVARRSLDDEYFYEDFDNESETILADESEDRPIITHTLVDLYCSQGHFEKAKEILSDILKLHPNDRATIQKLKEIKTLLSEDQGQASKQEKLSDLESAYSRFLNLIKEKSRLVA